MRAGAYSPPDEYSEVKYFELGNVREVVCVQRKSNGPPVKKVSADEFVWLETGEIGIYDKALNKSDSKESVKRTLANGRRLICRNFVGGHDETFVTLTYAENMTDTKRLWLDLKVFVKKVRKEYGNIEYIMAIEPQGRGAWHAHIFFKTDNGRRLWIDAKWLFKAWGHGRVNIKAIDGIDNLGAYLTADMTNMEAPDGETEHNGKRYKKGSRLHLYPSGMRIFRYSKGIEKPQGEGMSYGEAKKRVGLRNPTFAKKVEIYDDEREVAVNSVSYEQYNIKRSE